MPDIRVVHTNGEDPDFIELCRMLDQNLDEIVGKRFQRSKYEKFNTLDDIHDVVVLYSGALPVAGGAFKAYDPKTAEIKRVFVRKEYRGQGLSKILLSTLEEKAIEKGYERLVLETGTALEASMGLYRRIGFTIIENYGQYADMKESVCMEKVIKKNANP